MAGNGGVDVPFTTSEGHLDLLLAEELAVNTEVLRRFVASVWDVEHDGPMDGDLRAEVRLNVWDPGGPNCAAADAGENDIDLTVTIGSRTLRILVEDKMWAVFQPDQAARYRRRADSRGDRAVLVAPGSRLNHGDHASWFHQAFAIEDLAGWLDEQADSSEAPWSQRLRWRATVLRGLCKRTIPFAKPDHPPTVAFTRFCMDWLAAHEPLAVADPSSLRTVGNGWLYFSSPSGLVYKASNGRVDLYVAQHGYTGTAEDLAAAVATGWGPEGFVAAVDTKGNPVLRFEAAEIKAYSQDGIPSDKSGVERALASLATAARWLAVQEPSTRWCL